MKERAVFTFTETLVLASAGFLLIGLELPSLDDAKQKSQAAQCLSNMRQWGLAFSMYSDDWNDCVPNVNSESIAIDAADAWFNVLPPYLSNGRLKELYSQNRAPVPGSRSVFICPSAPEIDYAPTVKQAYFSYALNRLMTGGLPSCPENFYKRSIAALPAKIILLSESEDANPWFPFTDGYFLGRNTPRHSGGDNFLFVDAHAEWEPLAVYSWPSYYSDSAVNEWQTPKQAYWFPCKTCDKSCSTH